MTGWFMTVLVNQASSPFLLKTNATMGSSVLNFVIRFCSIVLIWHKILSANVDLNDDLLLLDVGTYVACTGNRLSLFLICRPIVAVPEASRTNYKHISC